MDGGLLSLKWNKHKVTFIHLLRVLKEKERCTDVTVVCDSKFYNLHKIVLMACSEFFCEVFENVKCPNPVIILNDIKHNEFECLIDYMYFGEVNVPQIELQGLIKAAESLRIIGLAVPDEEPTHISEPNPSSLLSSLVCERPLKRRKSNKDVCDVNSISSPISKVKNDNLANKKGNSNNSQSIYNANKSDLCDISSLCSTQMKCFDTSNKITNPLQPKTNSKNHSSETDEVIHIKQESNYFIDNQTDVSLKEEIPDIPSKCEGDNREDLSSYISTTVDESFAKQMFTSAHHAGPSGLQKILMNDESHGYESSLVNPSSSSQCSNDLMSVRSEETLSSSILEQQGAMKPWSVRSENRVAYRCNYCSRLDSDKSKWRRHLRTHTGERPFQCPQCHYRASTKHAVARHCKIRHGNAIARQVKTLYNYLGNDNAIQCTIKND